MSDDDVVDQIENIMRMDRTNFPVWDEKADERIITDFMKRVEGVDTATVNATLLNLIVEANVRTMLAYQPMRDDESLRTGMAGSLGRYITMKVLGIYDAAIEDEREEAAKHPKQ